MTPGTTRSRAEADLGYPNFLAKNGLSEECVQQLMSRLAAPVPNSEVDSVFRLGPSPIHNVGVFAMRPISKGEVFPVCRGAIRFNLARYTNHSDTPNVVVNFDSNGNGWMTMLTDLAEGREVTMDYNDNMAKSIAALSALNAALGTTQRSNTNVERTDL